MASQFDYTDDGGAVSWATDFVIQTVAPTRDPAVVGDEVSLDGSVREVTTVGAGQHERIFELRHESDVTNLERLIRAAARGIDITVTPDTDTPATTFVVQLFPENSEPQREARTGWPNTLFRGRFRARRMDGGVLWAV